MSDTNQNAIDTENIVKLAMEKHATDIAAWFLAKYQSLEMKATTKVSGQTILMEFGIACLDRVQIDLLSNECAEMDANVSYPELKFNIRTIS